MARVWRAVTVLALLAACSATTTAAYPQDLRHPNYVKRSAAVRRFAAERDPRPLEGGDAWLLLMDDHANIRLIAHRTIRELSPGGRDFGYSAGLPADVRAGVATRWEAWWRKVQAAERADG